MSEGPCCNDCYNSHGDCVSHGHCFCHLAYDAVEAEWIWCGTSRAADDLVAAVTRGEARFEDAVRVVGDALRTRYSDGSVRERRVLGVRRVLDHFVAVRLGEVVEEAGSS